MVNKLFRGRPPREGDRLLDPGCGEGAFEAGVSRWCETNSTPIPLILGVELDPRRIAVAKSRYLGNPKVKFWNRDFLLVVDGSFDYIIGNPPYVPITGLSPEERQKYRPLFRTAVERFDLYSLFFEKALSLLDKEGRLCFITPEKFEYVHSGQPLRQLLATFVVEEIDHVAEETFPGLVTYPTITTLRKGLPTQEHTVLVRMRDGREIEVRLPPDGSPWNPLYHPNVPVITSAITLEDICERVSCGIATGADSLFVHSLDDLPPTLSEFAYPTVSGRQLGFSKEDPTKSSSVMLIPYSMSGELLPEKKLGDLLTFLSRPDNQRRLKRRTCVRGSGKQWYRFHDNAPLADILKPKILCKDIAAEPFFWADFDGKIVPRHTVYYIVPRAGVSCNELLAYLNDDFARSWLRANCQRAASGFYRIQSAILKRLPVPESLTGNVRRMGLSRATPATRRPALRRPSRQLVLTTF
jgi:adenine-specific DNA-methyltransferase